MAVEVFRTIAAKVLIAEDDQIGARWLKRVLAFFDCESTIVDSGEQAVKDVALIKPDFVIMNINLSGKMDGIQAAEKIKEIINTKIIFLTGNGDPEVEKRAMALEPLAFLLKPTNVKKILDLIIPKKGL